MTCGRPDWAALFTRDGMPNATRMCLQNFALTRPSLLRCILVAALFAPYVAHASDGRVENPTSSSTVRRPIGVGEQWVQQDKLIASNGASHDNFAGSVAMLGNAAMIGAPSFFAEPSVYVFARSGTRWLEQGMLVTSDVKAGDKFGVAIAMSGDTALIGASRADDSGAAYIFTRVGDEWLQQAKLTADDGVSWDEFGSDVALDSDTALVGAYHAADQHGAAYVFTRSGGTWTQQARLVAPDGAPNDGFSAVALLGDTAVVGAPYYRLDATGSQGAAYVYKRSGAAWILQTQLLAEDANPSHFFGSAVALDGNTQLVGALGARIDDRPLQGAVYVYTETAGTWNLQAKLVATDGETFDYFGSAVALASDVAVIGSPNSRIGENPYQGAVYVFERSGNTWSQISKLTANDGVREDYFGYALAFDGEVILGGAFDALIGIHDGQGAAYSFGLQTDPIFASGFE